MLFSNKIWSFFLAIGTTTTSVGHSTATTTETTPLPTSDDTLF